MGEAVIHGMNDTYLRKLVLIIRSTVFPQTVLCLLAPTPAGVELGGLVSRWAWIEHVH